MQSPRRLRLVVGSVMLLLATLLVVGLVATGDRPLGRGLVLHVDFDYVDALKAGAEVRISALRVGRVLGIRHGASVAANEPAALGRVRVDVWISREMAHHVRQGSVFYVNSKGVVGERYLEIGPPAPDEPESPVVRAGQALRGVDFPELDRMLQFGFENLRAMIALTRELRPELRALGLHTARLRARLARDLPPRRVEALLSGMDRALRETGDLRRELAAATGDFALLRSSSDAVADATARLRRGLPTLRTVNVPELPPGWREQLSQTLARFGAAQQRVRGTLALAHKLISLVRTGQGTVGRILADPVLVDEIKETHRLLKNTPFKALGKPPPGRRQR